jgi:hypothetical protein
MVIYLAILFALAGGSGRAHDFRVGEIDFFGTKGIDVRRVRLALPVRKGDEVSLGQDSRIRGQIGRAVDHTVGHAPTDVALICCDNSGGLMIFVGLGGTNTATMRVHSAPDNSECLPRPALTLYDNAMAEVVPAVERGNSGEDDSRGYALSKDPALRSTQIAMRRYALIHDHILDRALHACRRPPDRRAASELLGYGKESARQIQTLAYASRDPDEGVRNNAIRALSVLAMSSPKTASLIPGHDFVEMLNSGVWEDRNKAGLLLMALTRSRDSELLRQLRADALASLLEMARWQDSSHATPYRVILGRIAGISESQIWELITSGRAGELIATAEHELQLGS